MAMPMNDAEKAKLGQDLSQHLADIQRVRDAQGESGLLARAAEVSEGKSFRIKGNPNLWKVTKAVGKGVGYRLTLVESAAAPTFG